jgi:hypothetical protein
MVSLLSILFWASSVYADDLGGDCIVQVIKSCSGFTCEVECVAHQPRRKCHITHILKCDTKGCDIMCIDGTKCRKDEFPIEWGTTVECK